MAHAYTPGLKVTDNIKITKTRLLPLKGEVVVEEGQRVPATEVVARTFLPGRVHPIKLAYKFSIPPEDLPNLMKVKEGDKVEKGQLLAESPGIFGFFKNRFESPVDGVLESISKVTGQIMLREPPTPLEIKAYISGDVAEIIPEEGVVMSTEGALIQGIFGLGGEKYGEIMMAVDSPEDVLTPDMIREEMKGKVVIAGSDLSLETYEKASQMGVIGLVVGGFHDRTVKDILGYDVGVAITGTEELETTLVITEGFGRLAMAKQTFELLQNMEGKMASINGATQIRAGVIRPEIIVPHEVGRAGDTYSKDEKEGIMEVGDHVRIIRQPHFGEIVEVTELPSEPVKIETEAKVRVLEVELNDGTRVTLPRANVELIEG